MNQTLPGAEIERARLAFLQQLNLLDTPTEAIFDDITHLAKDIFDVAYVVISLVDEQRQWFKSEIGLGVCETDRCVSFCQFVVNDQAPLIVTDATQDERFTNNPLVTDKPNIRSYVGIPLKPFGQFVIGSLAIIDTQPRTFSAAQINQLTTLAKHVERLIESRKTDFVKHAYAKALDKQTSEFQQALARHDTLFNNAAAGMIVIDQRGNIKRVNDNLLALFGYQEHELLGQNVKLLMPAEIASKHDSYLENYQRGHSQAENTNSAVINQGRELIAQAKDGGPIPIHLAVSEVIYEGHDAPREFVGIITDMRAHKEANQKLEKERQLLTKMHEGITKYGRNTEGKALWQFLQEALCELTNSDYSFIGEVVRNEQGEKAMLLHAITDLSWNDHSRALAKRFIQGEELISNTNSLMGKVFADGEIVLTNDFANTPGRGGHPEGHPQLHNYLGMPIESDGEVIGMVAIANCRETLTQETVTWLQPFVAKCSLLINIYRQHKERETFTEALKQANDELAVASNAKTEFLSSMSHELRTPLNSIIGFSQLLLTGKKHPLTERQAEQVKQINSSGRHLLDLINEILDLAKIEAGKLSVSLEAISLVSVLEESLAVIQPIADKNDITLVNQNKMDIQVTSDFTRLKQVFINILSNAVKYNRDHGHVTITTEGFAKQEQAFIAVHFTDTGIGIAAEDMDLLFEPFNRLSAENSGIEGTGVGLSLTKKLVEYMHGEITVTSSSAGSCFSVHLPLAQGTSMPDEDELAVYGAKQQLARDHKLVLYIEDNPANQRLMEDIFSDYDDLQLICAHEPYLGIELAQSQQPDLIIYDINLPGIDGYETKKIIDENPATASIPGIALSANAMPSDIKKGQAAGFLHYLTKPIDIVAFMQILDELLTDDE